MSKERLIIDRKFRSLIPALTKDELAMLTESLKREGCRDPIVTWRGKILDGHHRHEICTAHKIAYATREAEVKDTAEAKIWIIKNQFGRRNLQPFQRCELALKLKPLMAADAKRHQRLSRGRGQKGLLKKIKVIDIEKELAKIARVGKSTMNKVAYILSHGNAEELQRAREDKDTIWKTAATIKRRCARDEVDKRAQKSRKEFKGKSKPLANEPGTRIRYFTDRWGNKCYTKETRQEWCKDKKASEGYSYGTIKYNPEYSRLIDGVADANLSYEFDRKMWALEKAVKAVKWLRRNARVLKDAYKFDHDADSLATAKKHLWLEVMQAKKELEKILRKLNEEVPF